MKYNILIANANFYTHISALLQHGAEAALQQAGHQWQTLTVPGALELPAALRLASLSQQFDAYIALGCVIRGETSHYDVVCHHTNAGLQTLALNHGLLIGNGVLTVENEAQALARATPDAGNKGAAAVQAALALVQIKKQISK